MINRITLVLLVGLSSMVVTACDQTPNQSTSDATRTTTAPPRNTKPVAPDNTANNKPEMASSDKTPMDQAQNQSDISITAEIRRGIMKSTGMSTNAQNCKIITESGVVTLRGPVEKQAEKESIGSIAANVPGVVRVDNLLEVETGS